jgi:hypothetical protein
VSAINELRGTQSSKRSAFIKYVYLIKCTFSLLLLPLVFNELRKYLVIMVDKLQIGSMGFSVQQKHLKFRLHVDLELFLEPSHRLMGIHDSFLLGTNGQRVKLTTSLHLVPR